MRQFTRRQTVVEWVEGGDFAVAVEVEAVFPPDAPTEACLRPETVRWLESLEDAAARGDVATLQAAGRVYRRETLPVQFQ
ncbi:MAG: hypothetical protein B7Z55_05380 [Planctomycetales bacterium 12-60-4]|nr:MAG: hypothetical protein B7Z55_05380 [Planctomycetales bacterium 12-60-4]